MKTTWELNLKGNAASAAKRAHREVAALAKALRDLRAIAPLASSSLSGVASPATLRNLRTEVGLVRQLGRELKRNNTERDRARREDRRRTSNNGGPTRVDGLFSQRELARLRALGDANQRRFSRDRARREQNDQRSAARSAERQRRIDDQTARMARRLQQGVARDRARDEARGARDALHHRRVVNRHFAQQARNLQRQERARNRDIADPLGTLRRNFAENNPRLAGAMQIGGAVMGGLGAVASIVMAIVRTTLTAIAAVAGLAVGFAALATSLGHAVLQMIAFREGALMTLSTLARTRGEGLRPGETMDQRARRVRQQREGSARTDFYWAQDFARRTPLDMTQVVELQTQAAAAQYRGAQSREIVQAAADAGALHPNDPTTASRFILQMGQLRNSAVARSTDYRPAAMAAGVSETAAIRRAAIAAGVVQRQGEGESAYQRRIRTAQGNGQITGRQMHDAILAEQRAMLGGPAGSFATSQSGSIGATLSNLGESFQSFVTSIDGLERLPGILALKAMLTQIADTFAGATNNGKRLQAFFATFINQASGLVGGIFGPGGFDGALSQALDTAKELFPIVRGVLSAFGEGFMQNFAPVIAELRRMWTEGKQNGPELVRFAREFGRGLARISVFMLAITAGVFRLGAWLVMNFEAIERWAGRLIHLMPFLAMLRQVASTVGSLSSPGDAAGRIAGDAVRQRLGNNVAGNLAANAVTGAVRDHVNGQFQQIGQAMGDGVAQGFRDRQGYMQSEVSSVMNSLPTQARNDLAIKSPSRVFAEIGQYMAEGVTLGLTAGAPGAQAAVSSLVAPPAPGGLLGGLGGAAPNVTFHVEVNGAQNPEGVVDELRSRVEEIAAGFFERVALMGGAVETG